MPHKLCFPALIGPVQRTKNGCDHPRFVFWSFGCFFLSQRNDWLGSVVPSDVRVRAFCVFLTPPTLPTHSPTLNVPRSLADRRSTMCQAEIALGSTEKKLNS